MKKILLTIALVVSLAACKKEADTGAYEKSIKSQLEAMGYGKDTKVSCPKGVEMKEGNSFVCTITIDKKDYKFKSVIGKVDKDNNAEIASTEFEGETPPLPGGDEGGGSE